jgi:hypothetical protein
VRRRIVAFLVLSAVELAVVGVVRAEAPEIPTPESVVRQAVLANERRDIDGMLQFFLIDPDIESYGIGGLKVVGRNELERLMRSEFLSVSALEITIKSLKIWTRENVAWFAMELDYTRVLPGRTGETRMKLELRETGVLEKRDGQWLIHSWHESLRRMPKADVAGADEGVRLAKP